MPVTVRDILNPGETRTLSDGEVARIVRLCEGLGSALSSRMGIKVRAGNGWAADPDSMELIYDLGTAAILNDRARVGVIAHEAGHLRVTDHYDKDALPATAKSHPGEFHILANSFEDRRMELLMSKEFPGLAGDFEELSKTFDVPELRDSVKQASAAIQFIQGCYRMLYGRKPVATYPEVEQAIIKHQDSFPALVTARTTQALVDSLLQPGGVWETLADFLDNPPEPPQGGQGDGQESGEGGNASQGAGSGEDGQGDDAGDSGDGQGQDGDESGKGKGKGTRQGTDPAAGVPGSQDGDSGEGGGEGEGSGEGEMIADGAGQTVTDAGGSGTGGLKVLILDPENVEVPIMSAPQPESEADLGSLAALTDTQRAALDRLIEELAQSRQPEVRGVADQVQDRLDAIAEAFVDAGKAIDQHRAAQRHTADDDLNPSSEDAATYGNVLRGLGGKPSALSRDLAGVLLENSFDRWSVAAYKSGPRLHNRKLVHAAHGSQSVYRRKERPKNRRYAVSVGMDVSASMGGVRSAMAREASIMLMEALERARIANALYGFGKDTICVKPFDQPLAERRGRIGSINDLMSYYGANTCMGWAMKRMSEELLAQYDDSWQRMVIIVTDGMPNACGMPGHYEHADPRPFVRELENLGVDAIGIGIAEDGVKSIFPHSHVVLNDVAELPRTLVQVVRSRVRKG